LVLAVASGVSRLELDQKLKRRLIWIGLQTLSHFSPVLLERIGAAAARLIAEPSVRFGADGDTARNGVLSPEIDASEKRSVLLGSKATRELHAQLIKELSRVDAWKPFQPPTHEWPDHAQSLSASPPWTCPVSVDSFPSLSLSVDCFLLEPPLDLTTQGSLTAQPAEAPGS
jgi:hypothetical protein